MPRIARIHVPKAVYHIIGRFCNYRPLLDDRESRVEFLRRTAIAISKTDWQLLGYGLMSTHTHLAALAGTQPASIWVRPLHTGMALWLNNRRRKRGEHVLGSVYGDRFTDVIFENKMTGILLAYIHNNPCRASVVASPELSDWTSHRAYCGLEPAPSWLNIELGLELSGFESDEKSRQQFHEFVSARCTDPKNTAFSGCDSIAVRRNVRIETNSLLELATATVFGSVVEYTSVAPPDTPLRGSWQGTAEYVATYVAQRTGVSLSLMRGRNRSREISQARRIAMLAWQQLGRPLVQMSNFLGISQSSGIELLCLRSVRAQDAKVTAIDVADNCLSTTADVQPSPLKTD
jgi:putative transposase